MARNPDKLIIIKKIAGYEIIQIPLNENNNYHNLNIKLPVHDSLSALPVYNSNATLSTLISGDKPLQMRIYKSFSERKEYGSISRTDKTIKEVINKLSKVKQNQPYLTSNINHLISILTH